MLTSYRLGIDLGGTSAKIAIVTGRSRIVREASVTTAGQPRPAAVVDAIAAAARSLVAGVKIAGVGVGVAGDIDFRRGLIRVSPNLGWRNVPLAALLKKRLKRNVIVDNDANVAAWGLFKTQAPAGVSNMIAVTLGTGVGGGVVIDGKLHRGATGTAGEIGHMTMVPEGRPCNCGNRGCLETYAGGFYIVRHVRERLAAGDASSLRKLFDTDPDQISPLSIYQAAKKGDSFARGIWAEAGAVLGTALGGLVYVLNPERVVLTGGVAQAKDFLLAPIRRIWRARAFRVPMRAAKVVVAENTAHIGVIGASLLEPRP